MSAQGEAEIAAAVKEAWLAASYNSEYDPNVSWEDAGGDSLKTLELIENLEAALGREVPLDMVGSATTAAQLIQILVSGRRAADNLPVVHLLPGIGGDEPKLVDLRHALAEEVEMRVSELPGLDRSTHLLIDFVATAGCIADQIEQVQPSGSLMLAGFSFGGNLAIEVARQFRLRRRNVSFLCLLDPFPQRRAVPNGADQQMGRQPISDDVRIRILSQSRPRDEEAAMLLRGVAFKHWTPAPIKVPTLLVVTNHGLQHKSPAYYGRLISGLNIIHVPAGHDTIFRRESIAIYANEIIRRAQAGWNGPRALTPVTIPANDLRAGE